MDAKITRFLPDGPKNEGLGELRELITDGLKTKAPLERELILYKDPDGKFSTGIWECEAYEEDYEYYPQDEYMQILSGSVTMIDRDGNQEIFKEGDTFFVQRGFQGTWRQTEKMVKYFVIYTG